MTLVIPVEAPVSERAMRATAEAKRLLPGWASFARMLARKPSLVVKLTGGTPCTDGSTVWLRVPIELGDEVPHDKTICSKRGADKIMLCPACRVLDSVNTTIFHEMAHIIHGSFEAVPEADRLRIIDEAIKLECGGSAEGSRAAKIAAKIERHKDDAGSWIAVANLVSPFLPMLLNAVEDVWVNAEMMEGRPGTKVMFTAQTNNVFNNGIEREGGVSKWCDQPLNAQAVIGVYCKGSGLDYRSWLTESVVESLDDREIETLCHRIKTSRTAKARYLLAIQLLEALRRLGYLLSDEDEEDDEPDPGEGEAAEDGEPESSGDAPEDGPKSDKDTDEGDGEGGGSEGGDSDTEDGDEGDDDDTEGGDGTGDGDDDADGDDDEAFGSGLGDKGPDEGSDAGDNEEDDEGESGSHGEPIDGDHDSGSDVEEPDKTSLSEDGESHRASDPPNMGDPVEIEDIFKNFGRHEGEDDPPTPEEREVEEHVDRAIEQGEHFDAPSTKLGGVKIRRADDESVHMAFTRGRMIPPTPETILAPALAKLRTIFAENRKSKPERNLKRGRRIDRKMMGRRIPTGDDRIFTRRSLPGKRDYFVVIGLDISGSTGAGLVNLIKQAGAAQAELLSRLRIPFALYCHSGDWEGLEIFEIKGPNEPWGDRAKAALGQIGSFSANLDGHTLEFYRKRAVEHRATDKIIMYYTDGAMPAENYHEELAVLQRNIKVCKDEGITLVGVGIRNDDPVKHGLDTIRVDSLDDIPKLIEGLGKRLA